jgi:uncharacterized protein (DUF2062 family)
LIKKLWLKFRSIIIAQIKQGVSPHGLALSCAVGVSCGCFPLLGLSTLLSLLIGVFVRLNQPVLQVVHYLMWPIQLAMIPLLLRMGETMFRMQPLSVRPDVLAHELVHHTSAFFSTYGKAGAAAVAAWVLLSIPLTTVVYFALRPVFLRLSMRTRRNS